MDTTATRYRYMDKTMTVSVYASDGPHPPKVWGKIITNRIIETSDEATPEIKQLYQDEKHRIEALIASYIPIIRKEILGE